MSEPATGRRPGEVPAGWYDGWISSFRAACAGVPVLEGLSDRQLENLARYDAERLAWDPEARPLDARLPSRVEVRSGDRLIHAGGRENDAFLILSGLFDVSYFEPTFASGDNLLVAERGPGEWIGEQAALLNLPRTADVTARTDGVVLRVPACTLRPLYRRVVGRTLGPALVERAIEITLRHQPALRTLGHAVRLQLADAAELVEVPDGEAVFAEGTAPEFVYVVRTARVVVESSRASQRVLDVLGPLALFGEAAPLRGTVRTTTARADGDCELVAIRASAFLSAVVADAALATRMRSRAEIVSGDAAPPGRALDPLLAPGGTTPRQRRGIDPLKCIRCRMCEEACAESHDGFARLSIDEPATAGVRDSGACSNCEVAYCELACNYVAISRRRDGQVEIDPDLCVGCKACALPGTGCPYGSIQVVPFDALRGPSRPSFWRGVRRTALGAWYTLPWTHTERPDGAAPPLSGDATRVGPHGRWVAPSCDLPRREAPRSVAVKCDLCRSVGGPEQCVAACPTDAIRLDDLGGDR